MGGSTQDLNMDVNVLWLYVHVLTTRVTVQNDMSNR